jgi:hypothetical protein
MPTYVVRLWVPDRPGALGAVASRIGAVRGDLVGIDILERGAGTAIDELVVSLPDAALVPLLLKEIVEVEGVAVEDLHQVPGDGLPDPRLAALQTAAVLVEESTTGGLLRALVVHASHDFQADWVALADREGQALHATVGSPPPLSWIRAFVAGSRSMATAADGAEELAAADDMAWTPMIRAELDLVFGRPGRPVRTRERLQLNALASIADARWIELARRDAALHPSGV